MLRLRAGIVSSSFSPEYNLAVSVPGMRDQKSSQRIRYHRAQLCGPAWIPRVRRRAARGSERVPTSCSTHHSPPHRVVTIAPPLGARILRCQDSWRTGGFHAAGRPVSKERALYPPDRSGRRGSIIVPKELRCGEGDAAAARWTGGVEKRPIRGAGSEESVTARAAVLNREL